MKILETLFCTFIDTKFGSNWLIKMIAKFGIKKILLPCIATAYADIQFVVDTRNGKCILSRIEDAKNNKNDKEYDDALDALFK